MGYNASSMAGNNEKGDGGMLKDLLLLQVIQPENVIGSTAAN